MKSVSAKARFTDKAKQLFSTSTTSRELTNGVVLVRARSGESFKIGKFTLRTEAPAKRKA